MLSLLLNRFLILLEIAWAYIFLRKQDNNKVFGGQNTLMRNIGVNAGANAGVPQNILLFAYMGLGDAIMMLPMLRSIKEAYPDTKIHALTQAPSPAHEILRLSGCVETIEFFAFKQASLKERWKLMRRLRAKKFDMVFCSYVAPVPYFITLIRNIPVRVGHVAHRRGARNVSFEFLWTHPVHVSDSDHSHETKRYLALVEALGIETKQHHLNIALEPQPDHIRRATDYLRAKGVHDADICCGFHPAVGVTMPWRQWGVEKLIETAQRLQKEYSDADTKVWILLIGSNADKILLQAMAEKIKHNVCIIIPDEICLPEDIPLSMTMALLRKCAVLIANDGGIAHLATSCGTALVRVFGMADYYGYKSLPLDNNVRNVDVWKGLACSPCMGLGVIKPGYNLTNCGHLNCLTLITVNEVVQEASITLEDYIASRDRLFSDGHQ